MPIYEYRCNQCSKRSSIYFKSFNSATNARCEHCNSEDVTRLISMFAVHQSEQSRREAVADTMANNGYPGEDYYSDARNIGRWTEERFRQEGLDLPPEFHEMVGRAREGEIIDNAPGLPPLGTPMSDLLSD